jgi:IclR family acetate operon transcriptional repressor
MGAADATAGGSRDAATPGGPSRLTTRIVEILEAVVDAEGPVGPRGLARDLGIDRSAVGRTLHQLRDLGMLERRGTGYVPGPRLFTIGRRLEALDTLPNAARPILRELVDRFDETCYVCVRHGDAAVFLYEMQSSNPLRLVVELGRPVPLHAGAAGRAILAGLPDAETAALLKTQALARLTPRTVRSVRSLLALARADRERGYSISEEERIAGGAAIAAPFYDSNGGCQGSVVFTCPLTRLERDRFEEIGSAVRDAAAALSARLGYAGADHESTDAGAKEER